MLRVERVTCVYAADDELRGIFASAEDAVECIREYAPADEGTAALMGWFEELVVVPEDDDDLTGAVIFNPFLPSPTLWIVAFRESDTVFYNLVEFRRYCPRARVLTAGTIRRWLVTD